MGHSHGHHHHHGHGHHHHAMVDASQAASKRFLMAFGLNITFAIIELIGGILTNSVAVTSDALHDFGDAMAIGLAIFFERLSRKKSDEEFSYGYRRYSTLAALVTGLILISGALFILYASLTRLMNPVKPDANGMLILAFLGLAVNGFAAWRMSRGTSLSERMVLVHLLEDVFGWALVVIGAIAMKFYDLPQIDAGLGCVLAAWILFNAGRNLRETLRVFLQGMPADFDLEHLLGHVLKIEGVKGVHHVHVWSLDGERHIFTGHVIVDSSFSGERISNIKREAKKFLVDHGVFEATLEIEQEGTECVDPTHS